MDAKEALEKIKNEYDAYFIVNKYQCNGEYGFDKKKLIKSIYN